MSERAHLGAGAIAGGAPVLITDGGPGGRVFRGLPALVFYRDERPFAAVLLAVADGKIQRVFFHADLSRLRYLGHGRPSH